MTAGGRKWEVQIEDPRGVLDSLGEKSKQWGITIAGYRVEAIAKNAREFFSDARIQSDVDYLFVGHYREGILPEMRITYGSRVFDIVGSFEHYPKGYQNLRQLRIYAKERLG